MKQYLLHISIVFIAIVSFSCSNNTGSEAPSKSIDTIPALIMQVKQTSRLYTAEYNIRKIVTHDDVIRLKGTLFNKDFDMPVPIGDRKIAIPMNAKLKAYIDFSEFSEKNIERNGNKITIILPDPRVTLTGSKIDQKNIKEFVSLTRSYFSDAEMSDYERQGRHNSQHTAAGHHRNRPRECSPRADTDGRADGIRRKGHHRNLSQTIRQRRHQHSDRQAKH